MSFGSCLFGRWFHVPAEQRNAEDLAAELRNQPPLTIAVRLYADRTVGIGVRLDTSICLDPAEPYETITPQRKR
jgi:hypothetical protein